ncbi:MAG TPA: TRAP transporter small permease [Alphaproteobacteria bacterium]|jgi:TRAP-type C4-dicarboxylate transport system permease small subunit
MRARAAFTVFYSGFYTLIGLVCGLLIGAIALDITVDVVMRNLKLGSLSWVMEINEYALYAVTALGAPWALYRGAHVRVDLLLKGVPRALGRWLEALTDLVGLLASSVLLYYAVAVARVSLRENARVIKVLIIPEWWVYAVIAIGALLLVIEFTRRLALAIEEGPHMDAAPLV